MTGGHPRESIEASFDIVQEDTTKAHLFEAETIAVACQVIGFLPRRKLPSLTFQAESPLWFLRINHTRLADAVLDLCGVPAKESTRQSALQILGAFTAATPHSMMKNFVPKRKSSSRQNLKESDRRGKLETLLNNAVESHGLPRSSADKLRAFIEQCHPMPHEVNDCIERLKKAVLGIEGGDGGPKRMKRLEDAARALRSIKDLFSTLKTIQIEPTIPSLDMLANDVKCPLYVSVDLGLRQRRKHYHGGIVFQCIVLPDALVDDLNPDETNDMLVSSSGRGVKVAEGGNFSDLVRKHRPPGNFAASFVSQYTAAPIPICAGVRFSVGKLVELVYLDAACCNKTAIDLWNELSQKSSLDKQGIDILRQSLGHPFEFAESITVIVCSAHGMDSASTSERLVVASRLWAQGISAEYLPQSGIMLSILKRIRGDEPSSGASDWSLNELFGVCALLNIPFVVIVQPHLLRDKGMVRLRKYPYDMVAGSGGGSIGEWMVKLEDLATTIRGDSDLLEESPDEVGDSTALASNRDLRTASKESRVECIFVEHDQYFGNDRDVSKQETPQWKSYLKTMKSISMSAESFLSSLQDPGGMIGTPVFAVADVSFWVLREFGTVVMRRESEQSAIGAANEVTEQHPKHKRVLKTLAIAIDNFLKRHGVWSNSKSHASDRGSVALLLYSKTDDRFDMISVSTRKVSRGNGKRR